MRNRTEIGADSVPGWRLESSRPEFSPIHHIDAGVRTEAIAQLRRSLDAPKRDVGPLSDFERADVIERAQRTGGLPRGAAQGFLGSQAEQCAGHVEREQDGCAR